MVDGISECHAGGVSRHAGSLHMHTTDVLGTGRRRSKADEYPTGCVLVVVENESDDVDHRAACERVRRMEFRAEEQCDLRLVAFRASGLGVVGNIDEGASDRLD